MLKYVQYYQIFKNIFELAEALNTCEFFYFENDFLPGI